MSLDGSVGENEIENENNEDEDGYVGGALDVVGRQEECCRPILKEKKRINIYFKQLSSISYNHTAQHKT